MAISEQWLPRSITSLRSYSARQFAADLASGITVGLVALPLAMAFGIASGVTPQAGLYTAEHEDLASVFKGFRKRNHYSLEPPFIGHLRVLP